MTNQYVKLAKETIEKYIKEGIIIKTSKDLPVEMLENKAGVFVSIHLKKHKPDEEDLRGCIGTFLPTKNNIAEEIIDNSVSAATHDYRFSPIEPTELDNLEISVDILGAPIQIANSKEQIARLNPKQYGVIVKTKDGRTGLLLPDLEGVDSPELQISIACQKAGISPDEPIDLFRFEITRHKE